MRHTGILSTTIGTWAVRSLDTCGDQRTPVQTRTPSDGRHRWDLSPMSAIPFQCRVVVTWQAIYFDERNWFLSPSPSSFCSPLLRWFIAACSSVVPSINSRCDHPWNKERLTPYVCVCWTNIDLDEMEVTVFNFILGDQSFSSPRDMDAPAYWLALRRIEWIFERSEIEKKKKIPMVCCFAGERDEGQLLFLAFIFAKNTGEVETLFFRRSVLLSCEGVQKKHSFSTVLSLNLCMMHQWSLLSTRRRTGQWRYLVHHQRWHQIFPTIYFQYALTRFYRVQTLDWHCSTIRHALVVLVIDQSAPVWDHWRSAIFLGPHHGRRREIEDLRMTRF